MLDLDNFSQTIASVYDASLDVERWPDTLNLLARIFGSKAAQISVATEAGEIAFIKVWGWQEDELAKFMPAYVAYTPTDPRVRMFATKFKATHCRQVLSDETLRASDIYKQALAPMGVEYTMCLFVPVDSELIGVLGLMRGPNQNPFTADDCEDYGRLAPHVARAVSMHDTFRRCRDELETVKALLDTVPVGMMVVNDDELKMANLAARGLLGEGDAMRLHNGRLQGTSQKGDAELRSAVHEALSGTDQAIGLTLAVDHDEPVRAVVRRLHRASASLLGTQDKAVAVYVTDPRKSMETPDEILQRLFGLTAREASVLRVLVAGEDLQGIAATLGVGLETVRSHIQHIMKTTGARRQSELVRMVLSSPAWIAGSR